MNDLPIPQSRIEELMNAFISGDLSRVEPPQSRLEELWYNLIGESKSLPISQSRIEELMIKIIENDTSEIPLAHSREEAFLIGILTGEVDDLPIPQSRVEEYLSYIASNYVIDEDVEYVSYAGTNITAHNTIEKPLKSATLKGSTKYKDVDTCEILDEFDGEKNIELVSVKTPVLTTLSTTNLFCVEELLPGDVIISGFNMKSTGFIPVEQGEQLWFDVGVTAYTWVKFYTEDRTEIIQIQVAGHSSELGFYSKSSHVVPDNAKYMKVFVRENYINSMMVNRGNDYLPYEKGKPYKSNILTTPQDLVLRGIGDVKDELDLITGKLTQRIGEVVLDGSDDEECNAGWSVEAYAILLSDYAGRTSVISPNIPYTGFTRQSYPSLWSANNNLFLVLPKTYTNGIQSEVEFRKWLSQNPITIQYQLKEPIIKTVDLSIVNQDGNKVNKLSAFNDTTHIISSRDEQDSPVGEVTAEIPTKSIKLLHVAEVLAKKK